MRQLRLGTWFFVLACLFAVPAYLLADDSPVATAKNTYSLVSMLEGLAGTIMFAAVNYFFIGTWLLWLTLSWAVLTLYGLIGNYLIPLWDFSNTGAFLTGREANWSALDSLKQVVGVPSFVSAMLWSCVPFLVGFAVVLMAGLTIQSITKQAFRGEDPLSSFGGLFMAVGLMIAFPLLYSAPIILGNELGRDFYAFTLGDQGVIKQFEDQHDAGWGLGRTLLGSSFFSSQNAARQTLDPKTLLPTTGAQDNIGGLKSTADLEQQFQTGMSAGDTGHMAYVKDMARAAMTGASVATPAQAAAGVVGVANSLGTDATTALETLASRFVQIVLSIMGLLGLFGLLILKGGQVLAVVLNFFLAPIACAMYASPFTRPVFFAWLKAHITVCSWSFLWALLLVVIRVVVLAGEGLQGMGDPGTTGYKFAPVGMFLMPFFLFAGIKKFNSVAALADSLSMTGGMASQVASNVSAGFKQSWAETPGFVSQVAGNQVPGGGGSWMQKYGSSFTSGASGLLGKAATGLNAVAPGLGTAVSVGFKTASTAASAVGKSQIKANAMNPLASRWGMKPLMNTDKQKKPGFNLNYMISSSRVPHGSRGSGDQEMPTPAPAKASL